MNRRRIVLCIILFLSTVLLQRLVIRIAPIEGNFQKYLMAARLYSTSQLEPERITDFSPFYFELNRGLLAIFGRYESYLLLLQIIAAAISVVAFFVISEKYLPWWAAVLASVELMFSTGLIILSQIFVPDIWFVTFLLLALFLLLHHANENRSVLYICGAAFFFGLALFTRPTILLYVPFALAFILLQKRQNSRKAALYFVMIFFGCFVLFIFRNYVYTSKPTLSVMDSGGVFFEGNNPFSDGDGVNSQLVKELEGQYGDQPSYAQKLLKRIPSEVMGRELDADEANHYWQKKALNYIAENPRAYLRLFLRKIYRLFRSPELHDVSAAHVIEKKLQDQHFPFLPISIVTALALFGLYIKRKEWQKLILLYAGFFLGCVVPLIYFVSSRYRFALIPFLIFFSCFAIERCFNQLSVRKFRQTVLLIACTILTVVLLDWPEENGKKDSYIWQSIMEAHRLQKTAADLRNEGNRDAAVQAVSASLATAPFLRENLILANLPYPKNEPLIGAIEIKRNDCNKLMSNSCLFDLGLLLLESGNLKDASKVFSFLADSNEKVTRWSLCSPHPEYYLGRIAIHERRWNEALQHFDKVLQHSPGDPDTLAGISVVFEKTGNSDRAKIYREKLFRYFDEPDAMMFLGRSYWFCGEYKKSGDCFLQVTQWLSDYRKAHILAAVALGNSGEIDKAVVQYWNALAIKEEPLLLQEDILEMFEEYVKQHRTARAKYAYGVVLRQLGKFDQAFQIQQTVLQMEPDFAPAILELKGISKIINKKTTESSAD